jgi:thiol:disulfide interchange protein DsbD
MKRWIVGCVLVVGVLAARAAGTDPFTASARLEPDPAGLNLVVELAVPAQHIIYEDTFTVKAEGGALTLLSRTEPHEKTDTFTGELKKVFDADARAVYRVTPAAAELNVRVAYQGCDAEVCFFPQKKTFRLAVPGGHPAATGVVAAAGAAPTPAHPDPVATPSTGGTWRDLLGSFDVAGTANGYLKVEPFLAFLGGEATAGAAGGGRNLWWTLLLILLGGAALNLTPCVLPLVPINLAILGAGTRAASRRQGFVLGGLYGLAIAVVYGALGIAVVLFGAKFGALNASIAFNVVIAVVFLLMALAMFDVIQIDLSRFQSATAGGSSRSKYAAAIVAGAVSALLAGACVAPAVISTLVLSASLYAEGYRVAALLPFLLGAGMGLPWPFAGAGLSVLPKPGAWMVRVKQAMGVLILIMAAYYGYLAWSIGQARREDSATRSIGELEQALRAAQQDGRPVFIDFWATWCKNCEAMEATTFKDPAVVAKFAQYHVVKFQAEQPSDPPALEVLDQFKVVGLPTYVILKPRR